MAVLMAVSSVPSNSTFFYLVIYYCVLSDFFFFFTFRDGENEKNICEKSRGNQFSDFDHR